MDTGEIRDFRRTLRRFERITHSQLRSCCARVTLAQCLVLLEIDEDGRLPVGQLAARLGLDNSTLSRTIDGLVREGLLDRERDDQDRRVVRIGLTREGGDVCSAIHAENDELYRRIFDRIPAAKRKTVIRNFDVLVRAFLEAEREAD